MKSYPQHTAGLKSCNLLFESSIKCKKKQFYISKLFIDNQSWGKSAAILLKLKF